VESMRKVWRHFPGFGHAKHHLDPEKYANFQKRLIGVTAPDFSR